MAPQKIAEWDTRLGKVMNANLAEYLLPANADGADPAFGPLGAKGLAEIAICEMAPAIANAVCHATGRRVSHPPIRPETLIGPAVPASNSRDGLLGGVARGSWRFRRDGDFAGSGALPDRLMMEDT
jgi:hypothetical protein